MSIHNNCWVLYVVGLLTTFTVVSCTPTHNNPTATPSSTPTLAYEEQMEPENGWQAVAAHVGSGMANFCPSSGTFSVSKPWRLRWRVGRITNSKSGNGKMSIEILNKADSSTFSKVKSDAELSEFTSEIFTAKGKSFCLLARSSGTGYTIWVEQRVR